MKWSYRQDTAYAAHLYKHLTPAASPNASTAQCKHVCDDCTVFTVAWNVNLKYGFYVGFGVPVILTAFSFYAAPQVSSHDAV